MRRHTRIVVLLLVASLVIAVAPAASAASHSLKATFTVDETSVTVPDMPGGPAEIATRCGEDWPGWIFRGSGVGTLTVGKDTYDDAEFVFEHCSRWVTFDPARTTGRFVGKSEAGEMIVTIPDVGSLELAYDGTWVFQGQVPFPYTADLKLSYSVVGGTEAFSDVSRGRGHLSMTVGTEGPPYGTGSLVGSLK